jgi:hypothetical protein
MTQQLHHARTSSHRKRFGAATRSAVYGTAALLLAAGTTSIGPGPAGAEVPTGTRTFTVTGTTQVFVVPPGITQLTVDARGAQGSMAHPQEPLTNGGKGGRVRGNLTVTPGEVLFVEVGGAGKDWKSLPNNGGYNGGGNGTDGGYWGSGGGGGGSDIRRGQNHPFYRLFSAGGGGGGAVNGPGGASGSAGSGTGAVSGGGGGAGGTTTGGSGGTGGGAGQPGQAGNSTGVGGIGGTAIGSGTAGGGGGGGWRGGGGGGGSDDWSSSGGGGGGGSSYGGALSGVTISQGVQAGEGMIQLSWAAPLSKPVTPTATSLTLSPAGQQRVASFPAQFVARVLDQYGDPIGGVPVHFTRSGSNTDTVGTTVVSASDGTAAYTYGGMIGAVPSPGTDVVFATVAGAPTARAAGVVLFGEGTGAGAGTEVVLMPPVATTAPGATVDLPFTATDQEGGRFTGTIRYGTGPSCGSPDFTSSATADASGTGTITVTAGDGPTCVGAYADRAGAGAAGSRDDTEVLAAGAVVPVGPPSPGTEVVFTTPATAEPSGVTMFAGFVARRYDGSPFVGTVRWGYGPAGSSPDTPNMYELDVADNGQGFLPVPVPGPGQSVQVVAYADRSSDGRPGTRDETEVPGTEVVTGGG